METKQVIIIRRDLNMRKGKLAAQCCHASMKVILDKIMERNDLATVPGIRLRECDLYEIDPLYHWLNGLFTKVVVGCDSESELFELKRKADEAGILNAVIQDAGKTEFNGIPTYTALAIGPDTCEKIDLITGHLKLL